MSSIKDAFCNRFIEKFHGRKSCIKYGAWEDGTLRCSKCGKVIAFAALWSENTRLFVMPSFEKYITYIKRSNPTSYIATFRLSEFDELISQIRGESEVLKQQIENDFDLPSDLEDATEVI